MNKLYKINMRRYWYGPRETVDDHLSDEDAQPWRGTHAEAMAEITRLEAAAVYITASGESGRATYRIAPAAV